MNKRFRVLRVIGTLWKALAWVALIAGILSSLAVLLVGVLGSGGLIVRLFQQETGMLPGAMGVVSSILGFGVTLVGTIIYFLTLYAVGDLIYLLLAIEENTRQTMHIVQQGPGTREESAAASPPPSPSIAPATDP